MARRVASAGGRHAGICGDGGRGVNYHRCTWHHPMIVLDAACRFVEVHRAGPGDNCDEAALAMPVEVRLPEPDSSTPR